MNNIQDFFRLAEDELRKYISHEKAQMRYRAILCCTTRKCHNMETLNELVRIIAKDPSSQVRVVATNAIQYLQMVGDDILPIVASNLRSKDYSLRAETCWCIAKILEQTPHTMVSYVEPLCHDESQTVRYVACFCLNRAGVLGSHLAELWSTLLQQYGTSSKSYKAHS